jgi:hypothetical protein
MTTAFALIGVVTLLANSALADPIIVKKRALETRDQNNVRQGVPPPSSAPQPQPQPARPAATTAAPTPVQQSLARVRADLAAIKPDSQVTPEQKQQLSKDLLATAQGANKPSSATTAALANELSAAVAQKPLSDSRRNRLLTDLAAVLNPGDIQPTQMQAIVSDVQAIFQANGMMHKDAAKVSDAVKAVAAETRR